MIRAIQPIPDAPPPGPSAEEKGLARAWGAPVASGRIRQRPEDFRVDECLGFGPSGDGPHVLVRVEKTRCNTADAAALLAAHAGVPVREVGYCGLKDRHAVCTQWLSVPHSPRVDWGAFEGPGVRILETGRHHRKLKRGAHQANRFDITVGLDGLDDAGLDRRLEHIRSHGVPNYFGEQRFGRRYPGNARRLLAGGRLTRLQRGMTLSAIRSDLFNRVVDERVRRGNWNVALPGEYVNLDGTRSGFAASGDDPEIAARIRGLDLHPTGPLHGGGANPATGEAALLERGVLRGHRSWCEVLVRNGLKMERRAARCVVRDLQWRLDDARSALRLGFVLRRGQFATMVLREVLDYRDVTRGGQCPDAIHGE